MTTSAKALYIFLLQKSLQIPVYMILDLVFDLQINFNETTYRYRKANSVIHKNTLVKIIAVTSISWRVHITHFLKLTLSRASFSNASLSIVSSRHSFGEMARKSVSSELSLSEISCKHRI